MFFDSWAGLGRVALRGVIAYVALVVLLRSSGNRTLSKLNAFDLVITVALGSTLATILVSERVALAEGVLALGLIVALQYAVTWTSVRSPRANALVKSQPSLLVLRGRFLSRALRCARVTEDEVRAVLRRKGVSRVEDAAAVVLESDGSISVVAEGRLGEGALADVRAPCDEDLTVARDERLHA